VIYLVNCLNLHTHSIYFTLILLYSKLSVWKKTKFSQSTQFANTLNSQYIVKWVCGENGVVNRMRAKKNCRKIALFVKYKVKLIYLSSTHTQTHTHAHTHTHTHTHTHAHEHTHTCLIWWVAINHRALLQKEPQILGLFCGKRPVLADELPQVVPLVATHESCRLQVSWVGLICSILL